jgi:pimeloyl-ACP methyl ester carboxylesterase
MADFPRDNFIPLRHLAERATNIVRWTTFDRGGHFPAMEQPELLAGDITAFFRGSAVRPDDQLAGGAAGE